MSPFPEWSEDGPQPYSWGTTQPDGEHKIYHVDWPGFRSGGWDADAGSHWMHITGLDGEGAFKLRTRVKFKGYWCTKEWLHWTRELRVYSNDTTGNKWVANVND